MPVSLLNQSNIPKWNLNNLLEQTSKIHGDHPFIIGPNTLTYNKTASLVRETALWFQRMGVKRGDRVMIITMNRIETVLTAFAAAKLGAIFIVINNAIKPYGLRLIINQCEPSIVILDKTTLRLASEIKDSIIVWAGDKSKPENGIKFNTVLTGTDTGQEEFPGINRDNNPVCIIYTSGSTGVPRGVVVSYDNIRFSTAAIQERLRYQPDDVVGLFLPLSFDYGLYQIFLSAAAGASIFIGRPEFTALKLISQLKKYNISVLPGVPNLFAVMFKLLAIRPQKLPALRCITSSGDYLASFYIGQMRKYFPQLQIFLMYGLTECKRVSILKPDEMEAKAGSVGRPLKGTLAYLVGENGRPTAIGESGELVVRGRHVTMGYLNVPGETRQRFRQRGLDSLRELYTGDLCRIDKDGFIYFVGRKDNQFKHQGFRLDPLEIEKAACNIKGILEAGLVQSKNPEQLHLFIIINKPGITIDNVKRLLKELLEPFKVPERIYIASELPKTPHGKLDRKKLYRLCLKILSQNQK